MDTKLLSSLSDILSSFPEYWEQEELQKNKVIEDLKKYRFDLIKALLTEEQIIEFYTLQVGGTRVFKLDELINVFRYRNYWENSYTKYTNKIGLTSEGKYLDYNSDVVLDFPHKDCVLEGGMSTEDVGQEEIYYNKIIAKDEVDTLLVPKVFKNIKKYSQNKNEPVTKVTSTDNLIIKGNNLLALHSLKEKYANKIKLIYIDPPYNTGNDSFKYNDRFSRSTWLTFMKNRLEIAFSLLSENGSIFIQCDDNQQAYLKVLCDEVFGEQNFVNNISVKMSESSGTKMAHVNKRFSKIKESILLYKKSNLVSYNPIKIPKEEWDSEYSKFLLDFTKEDKNKIDLLVSKIDQGYAVTDEDIIRIDKIFDKTSISSVSKEFNKEPLHVNYDQWLQDNSYRIFRTAASSSVKRLADVKRQSVKNDIFSVLSARDRLLYLVVNNYSETSTSPRVQILFAEDYLTKYIGDLWKDIPTTGLEAEGNVELKNAKKPEKLLQRIIEFSTEPKDIVLDFFMGSATTQAVALKMDRKFIGIEQMDYINEVSVPRLQKVIEGEQGGISENVDWQGGGSFIYAELYDLNNEFIARIREAKNQKELNAILDKIKTSAYLNFKVELNKITTSDEEFQALSLENQKKILIDLLDMNQLYLNYSEISDSQYDVSDDVKKFNDSFYQKGDLDE